MLNCLVVDDEVVCRRTIARLLIPHAQCRICTDGYQGVEAFSESVDAGRPYDLVFLDIAMPGMSGHDTLTAIREIEHSRGILGSDGVRVIMVTSLADYKQCMRAFSEGCEVYLLKPYTETELFESIRQVGFELAAAE
jgi:two-component system, chemotaxis family, chemotaxis protein CheY